MRLNQGYTYRHVLGPIANGHSSLSYLASNFPHSTESEWQERLNAGEVLLDDKQADGIERLRAGMLLVWNRPGWFEEDTPQEYNVKYQDKQLLAVEKPSGLPTLPGAGFYLNTLLNLVRTNFPEARPLHRLGRATSGLVLFAFNTATASALIKHWPKMQKEYRALGSMIASRDCYDIRSPIGELEHPRLGKVHAANAAGKPARSVAWTLQRRSSSTLFDVDLLTGRPHQIRIHLACIGHPLVGDTLYASGGHPRIDQPGLPGDAGYWLHAKRLILEHPNSRERLDLESRPPEILRVN